MRALETLAGVDIIACEDTRITRRLTERYGISALLTPYHEHNAAQARPKILRTAGAGRLDRAGLGCRHAADFRSRLQAGARGLRRRPCRHRAARPLLGAGGAVAWRHCRPTGFSSRDFCRRKADRAPRAARGAGADRRHAGYVRIRQPRCRTRCADLAEHHGHARRRDLPRNDQAARGDQARAGCRTRALKPTTLETRGEFVLVIGPPAAERRR